jgi:hypothetical protein
VHVQRGYRLNRFRKEGTDMDMHRAVDVVKAMNRTKLVTVFLHDIHSSLKTIIRDGTMRQLR